MGLGPRAAPEEEARGPRAPPSPPSPVPEGRPAAPVPDPGETRPRQRRAAPVHGVSTGCSQLGRRGQPSRKARPGRQAPPTVADHASARLISPLLAGLSQPGNCPLGVFMPRQIPGDFCHEHQVFTKVRMSPSATQVEFSARQLPGVSPLTPSLEHLSFFPD